MHILENYEIVCKNIVYSFLIISIVSGIQLNETVHDSLAGNDFVAELPSHHQFNLRTFDLAKLLVIRTAKNNKKKDRLFKQMGLSNVTDITTPSRKIFLSKQTKLLKSTINTTVNSQ
ncbi:unnamed protein product, partial [Rotaria magnacalcarata]